MKIKTIVAVSLFGLFCAGAGSALAAADNVNTNMRGPAPFALWDADGSGGIDQQEFKAMRGQRQAAVQAAGRQGRNMNKAVPFAQIDSNGDGVISPQELAVIQAVRFQTRPGTNRSGYGMARKGGMGYHQNMDAETRQKYDEFLIATLALRQEIAAKRVEKRTIMRLVNPDADRAAKLTRESIELRSQLMKQANQAGVPFGRHGMGHKGHGGGKKGHGNGPR